MYWLYKNLFFFLKHQNFYAQNFFFLNYFNCYLIINFNNQIGQKKNLSMSTHINSNKNILYLNKNNLILKYLKYFNKIIFFKNNSIKLNQLNYYGTYNNYNLYYFNNYNYFFYKKFINLINQISNEGFNFVILDRSYKNVLPIYNYTFSYKNIALYKKYFFVRPSFFTFGNWNYHYSKFLEKFKIVLIVIFDFQHFNKFFKILNNANLPVSTLVPFNNLNEFIDYPIFTTYSHNFEKFLFLNLITQMVLISFNYKSYNNKIRFLKIFYNFSLKISTN